MPDITVTSALDKVRQYLGDDHAADRGTVPDSANLTFLQAEYASVWDRLARSGCVPPTDAPLSTTLVDYQDDTPGPVAISSTEILAVVDVFEYLGGNSGYRFLVPAQPGQGAVPFDDLLGTSTHYAVNGMGSGATIQLWPHPGLVDNYYLRFIPAVKQLVKSSPGAGQSASITGLPDVGVDRVILGAARRALMTRRESSPMLNQLIAKCDEDISFHVAGRLFNDAPRARNVDYKYRGWRPRGQDAAPTSARVNPGTWMWLF